MRTRVARSSRWCWMRGRMDVTDPATFHLSRLGAWRQHLLGATDDECDADTHRERDGGARCARRAALVACISAELG